MAQKNYYKILQVDSEADDEIISAAYRRLAQKYHPDVNKSRDATTRMQELNEAYAVLGDANKRAQYDRERGVQPSSSTKTGKNTDEERRRQEAEAILRKRAEAEAAYRRAQAEEETTRRNRENAQAAYERATGADKERQQREEETAQRKRAEAEAETRRQSEERRKQQETTQEQQKKVVSRRRLLRAVGALGIGGVGYMILRPSNPPSPVPVSSPTKIPSTTISPTIGPPTIATENLQRIELVPNVDILFVRIPAGSFLMGSDITKDSSASNDELPQHTVYLSEYWIGRTEVTVAQFEAFVKDTNYKVNSSTLRGTNFANHSANWVSWYDATAFCVWASKKSGVEVTLPSEAQWEKAARGADGKIYPWGNTPPNKNLCNFNNNVGDTTLVGKYSPQGDSPYGCADMVGNVWEWCADWYDPHLYTARKGIQTSDPTGPAKGDNRVLRGGSWNYPVNLTRCAIRYGVRPDNHVNPLGFRVVLRS